ncbi:hypothetical protein Avbf_11280, partial [Armadillidium vulgare]
GNYFGVPLENPQFQELENNSSLNDFLDSGSTQILGSHFLPSEKRIIFTSRIQSTSANEKSLVFFKVKPTVITKENLDEIFVSSMLDFSNFFIDSEWSGELDPKLQALVTELSDVKKGYKILGYTPTYICDICDFCDICDIVKKDYKILGYTPTYICDICYFCDICDFCDFCDFC